MYSIKHSPPARVTASVTSEQGSMRMRIVLVGEHKRIRLSSVHCSHCDYECGWKMVTN